MSSSFPPSPQLPTRPLKGWWTLIAGLLTMILPTALTYLGGVDWTALGVSPAAGAIIGAVIIALRAITSSPIGRHT
jgi:hypothetical protein